MLPPSPVLSCPADFRISARRFPITRLGIILILAPMYGGGALLIREIARRTGGGWPMMITLALAYGIFEEAFTTQTLFNPNYPGLNLHLLDHAFIPALGIGAWWTVFVLTLHTVWSVSVSIGLAEALVPDRATEPWLRALGLTIVSVLFVAVAVMMTNFPSSRTTIISWRRKRSLHGRRVSSW